MSADRPDSADPGAGRPDGASVDPGIAELRELIDRAADRPVAERAAVFDEVNARLASELAALDEL